MDKVNQKTNQAPSKIKVKRSRLTKIAMRSIYFSLGINLNNAAKIKYMKKMMSTMKNNHHNQIKIIIAPKKQ